MKAVIELTKREKYIYNRYADSEADAKKLAKNDVKTAPIAIDATNIKGVFETTIDGQIIYFKKKGCDGYDGKFRVPAETVVQVVTNIPDLRHFYVTEDYKTVVKRIKDALNPPKAE